MVPGSGLILGGGGGASRKTGVPNVKSTKSDSPRSQRRSNLQISSVPPWILMVQATGTLFRRTMTRPKTALNSSSANARVRTAMRSADLVASTSRLTMSRKRGAFGAANWNLVSKWDRALAKLVPPFVSMSRRAELPPLKPALDGTLEACHCKKGAALLPFGPRSKAT
jgi:hypothetical protein